MLFRSYRLGEPVFDVQECQIRGVTYSAPLRVKPVSYTHLEFHSGEQLGETLGMSRAAINKHIQTLRDWGVDVFTAVSYTHLLPQYSSSKSPFEPLVTSSAHSSI